MFDSASVNSYNENNQTLPSHSTSHHTHHLVHAFARVPMQESLASEHRRELLRDALEQLLNGSAVAYKNRHSSSITISQDTYR